MATASPRPPAAVAHAARSDVGRRRELNEDRHLAAPPLFVVADGLGGHNAGEVAAQIVVDGLAGILGDRSGPDVLADAIQALGSRILEGASEPGREGMSSTCVAVHLTGNTATIAHVGDSRAYLLRTGSLRRLTEDHTLVNELVRTGVLAPAEAEADHRRHVLTQALGAVRNPVVSTVVLDLQPGDRLLLCSDGLSGQVPDREIEAVLLENGDPGIAADELVARANAAGGIDNVTVVVVDPAAVPAHAESANAVASRPGRLRAALRIVGVGLAIGVVIGLVAGVILNAAPAAIPPAATAAPVVTPEPSAASSAAPASPEATRGVTPSDGGATPSGGAAPSGAGPTPGQDGGAAGQPTALPSAGAGPQGTPSP